MYCEQLRNRIDAEIRERENRVNAAIYIVSDALQDNPRAQTVFPMGPVTWLTSNSS